jgi:hypothetical protein
VEPLDEIEVGAAEHPPMLECPWVGTVLDRDLILGVAGHEQMCKLMQYAGAGDVP